MTIYTPERYFYSIQRLFLGLLLLLSPAVWAQGPPAFTWARNMGLGRVSPQTQTLGTAVAVDAAGNTYVSGTVFGTTTIGNTSITSTPTEYGYLAKLDAAGQVLWVRRCGASAARLGIDASGNVYLAGYYINTQGIVFGTFVLPNMGTVSQRSDVYVAKISPAGNWLWAVRAGGANKEELHGMAVDAAGNVHITGYLEQQAVFGTLPTLVSRGFNDIYVAKLDTNGNWLWAVSGGGNADDESRGLNLDSAGNIYILGTVGSRSLIFGNVSTMEPNAYRNMLVAKLSPRGVWRWVRVVASPTSDIAVEKIAVDSTGHAYALGQFNSRTLAFGSHVVTNNSSANNMLVGGYYRDVFIAKMDSSGSWMWARSGGGATTDSGTDIAVNARGTQVTVLGQFESPSSRFGNFNLVRTGMYNFSTNIFALRLDGAGNWLWAVRSGAGSERASDIALDAAGNTFITGSYTNTAVIGPFSLPGDGTYSTGYVARLESSVVTGVRKASRLVADVYPNPSGRAANLRVGLAQPASELRLCNVLGQQVQKVSVPLSATVAKLPVAGLPAGTYVLQVQGPEGVATQSIVLE